MARKLIRPDGVEVRCYAPGDGNLCFVASYLGKAQGCDAVTKEEASRLCPEGWEIYHDGPYFRARKIS